MNDRVRDILTASAQASFLGAAVFTGTALAHAQNDYPTAAKTFIAASIVALIVGVALLVLVVRYETNHAERIRNTEALSVLAEAAHDARRQEQLAELDRRWCEANLHVALMAIRPEHVARILNGSKTVELRRRPLRANTTDVLIYETAPVSAVVGAFRVEGQVTGNARAMARHFARPARISQDRARRYLTAGGNNTGTAIRIGHVLKFETPVPLSRLGIHSAPQAPRYVDAVQVVAISHALKRGTQEAPAQEEAA